MIITLRPNVDMPLRNVLSYRDKFDELGIYSYVFHNNREPNTFGRLHKERFWQDLGKPVVVETGALNEHNPNDINQFIDEVIYQHTRLGALMQAAQFDESLRKLSRIGVPDTTVAQRVLPMFSECAKRGLEAHIIEPFPAISLERIQDYVSRITRREALQRVVLDVDIVRWEREMPRKRWYHTLLGSPDPAVMYRSQFREEMRGFRDYLAQKSIELSIILGSPANVSGSEALFLANAYEQWDLMREFKPDGVTVQSWEPGNPQDWPPMPVLERVIEMAEPHIRFGG